MLLSYIKIAFRNIIKEKFYTIINVSGLAIGIAASLVILMYVKGESNYDNKFSDSDRIYRIGVGFMNLGNFANAPEVLKDYLDSDIPEIVDATRLRKLSAKRMANGDLELFPTNLNYVDENFFQVFDFPFEEGSADQAVIYPNSIVLTKTLARQFFGDELALGELIEFGDEGRTLTVTGVIDEKKFKTHLLMSAWLPIRSVLMEDRSWQNASFYTYVKLAENTTREQFETSLEKLRKDVVYPTLSQNTPYEEWANLDNSFQFFVEPVEDIYLRSELIFQMKTGGNLNNIYVFSIISFLILTIAAVNFVNLSTARSARRAREVGIRKAMGSTKASLVLQFLLESLSISFLAMVFAFGLAEVFLIIFEQVSGFTLIDGLAFRLEMISLIILITTFVGLLAGLYPSFYLSSFSPSSVLKGTFLNTGNVGRILSGRNMLVIFQFTISICLIICSLMVFKQLNFLRNKDLGFQKENVVVIDNIRELGPNAKAFKETMANKSYVNIASLTTRIPGGSSYWVTSYKTETMEDFKNYNTFMGDFDYLKSMGFEVITGRAFNPDMPTDSSAIILNESAVKDLELGSAEEALGTIINEDFIVIGVVRDFNFESLHKNIEPAIIKIALDRPYRLACSIQMGSEQQFIEDATSAWQQLTTGEALNYYFLEDNFEKMLSKENTLGQAVGLFTILAIFISCLGLFGLAAYTSERRTKEIGVRKVLGASTKNIILLMSKGFMIPVLISFIMAVPISLLAISRWLEQFAYKSSISPLLFLVSMFGTLLLAWLTVLYYSTNLALMNPVESLREE